MVPAANRLPKLPALVEQKLTKTGYTRGATLKEIYQNRVTRNNPVLIPWEWWDACKEPDDGTGAYEKGSIVLVEPSWYFDTVDADDQLAAEGVELGVNALILFRRRADWVKYQPTDGITSSGKNFVPATSRFDPLGGIYFARVHATVAESGAVIISGFDSSALRGAGIRVYEYASKTTIENAKLQLEALVWMCHDADAEMVTAAMTPADMTRRRNHQLQAAQEIGALDLDRLRTLRMINRDHQTICPLCMKPISAADLMKRSTQAEGRETYDLTTTEISLFHIQELRVGRLQHKPYNLGWGHHFCNIVVKDAGIMSTLEWMTAVLNNQIVEAPLDEAAASVEQAVDG